MAAVTTRGPIELWNIATGQRIATMPGHGGAYLGGTCQALAFSPDGKTLATGGADGLVKLWDVSDGKLAATLTWEIPDGPPRWVMSLAFSPSGHSLAVGGGFFDAEKDKKDSDGRWRKPVVWVWDVAAGPGKLLAARPKLTGGRMDDSGVTASPTRPTARRSRWA